MRSTNTAAYALAIIFLSAGSSILGSDRLIKVPSIKAHRESTQLKSGPFKGVDPSKLDYETGSLILAANFDFTRLKEGMDPLFAVEDGSILHDGGTQIYKGKGYQIILLRSISTFGKLTGISVGIILIFDEDVARGNNREFAETSFRLDENYP